MLFVKLLFSTFNLTLWLLNFFMNWASNVAQVLLNTCNHQYIETHFIFSIFFTMSRPRPIFYFCDILYILSLIFVVVNHITSLEQTHLYFVHFVEYLLLFLDDNVDKNSENSASGCCLPFAKFFANFSLVWLIKVLLIKKACSLMIN